MWTKTTAIEQYSRAFFEPHIAAVTVTDHAPVHVRHNMIERDIILTHQFGCELRGAVDGAVKIVVPVYTHFDPDGGPVSFAFVIGMLSGFVSGEGLVNGMIVHSEMPSEKSSAIVTASEPLVHGERVMQCIGATGSIVGRMNSDKCRPHRPMQGTSAFLWGNNALRDFQFGCTSGSRAANGSASRTRRTGRKEKPYQDNSKKPEGAKFHRREVNLTRIRRQCVGYFCLHIGKCAVKGGKRDPPKRARQVRATPSFNRQGQAHIVSTAIVLPGPGKANREVEATPWFRTSLCIDPQPASISPTVNISIVFICGLLLIVAGSLPPRNQNDSSTILSAVTAHRKSDRSRPLVSTRAAAR